MAKGLDTREHSGSAASCLVSNGFTFILRYYAETTGKTALK